ncbi:MAG: membrane protein insertase YidC, partial [Desulfobacterota bacterium]|nr:membrane protein insertase YidC [Thermodesulfobacteriota bacterium]
MDEKQRTMLALGLTAVILITWFALFDKMNIGKETPAPAPQKTETATKPSPTQPAEPPELAPAAAPQATMGKERNIIVETPLYTATFSTRGARLTSFKLKKYLTTMGADAQGVEILRTPMPTLLLNRGSSDEGFMYESSTQGTMVIGNTPGAIEFRTTPSTGITLKKIYTIDPQTYLLGYRTVIENHTTAPMAVSGEIIFNNSYPLDKKMEGYAFQGPVLVNGKHLEEFKIDKVKKIGTYREFTGDVQWFGFEDKYFLQAIISKAASSTTLTIKRIDEKLVELHYALTPATVQAGSSLSRDNLIFMGPKELRILKAAGYNLNKALDFGFFDI